MNVVQEFGLEAHAPSVDLSRACLLLAAAFDARLLRRGAVDAELDALGALASRVAPAGDPVTRLAGALGGFRTVPGDYSDLRASLLHQVRRSSHGLPILLSVLWLDAAARNGIAAFPVGLRGHFVVGVGDPAGEHRLVDAARGGRPWRLRTGDAADVRPWEPVQVLQRILANIMAWTAGRADRTLHRLSAVDLSLALPHHPLALRRERGLLLVRTGDFLGGARELTEFAQLAEGVDEAAARAAEREARQARSLLN